MKHSFIFLVAVVLLLGCNKGETKSEMVDCEGNQSEIDSSECNVVLRSLEDFAVSGSYIKIHVKFKDSVQTVIMDNMAFYQVYGFPRKIQPKEYVKRLYDKIENDKPLEVTESEYNKLRPFSFVKSNDNELVLDSILSEYFDKNGAQKKHFKNDLKLINLLIESGYSVWTDDYSGSLKIKNCDELNAEESQTDSH
jgi:hypothetical protein